MSTPVVPADPFGGPCTCRCHARTAYLEKDRDFWKEQYHFAANVASTIADLDEEAPALRQMLARERDRRKGVEAQLDKAEYTLQQNVAERQAERAETAAEQPTDAQVGAL